MAWPNDLTSHLIRMSSGSITCSKAHPAFLIADLVLLCERLRAAGVAVVTDDVDIGVERRYVADPFGIGSSWWRWATAASRNAPTTQVGEGDMASPSAIPPVVKAIIRRDQHLLLVEEQGPDDPVRSWMLPGGRVEPGETHTSALEREIREETELRVIGMPTLAFTLEIGLALDDAVGIWRVATYTCNTEGTVEPSDPSILSAEWLAIDDALRRLDDVEWYDAAPVRAYLGGAAPPGSSYGYRISGRPGAVVRSAASLIDRDPLSR